MWLPHGKPIQPKDVEVIVSESFRDLREFINLCNTLAWATRDSVKSSLPSFTGRYQVKDGGIDVEWMAFELQPDEPAGPSLLTPGWNIFQYKQSDVTNQDRDKCFNGLKSKVSEAVNNLYKRTGRRPDGYVLFTNLDLTHYTAFGDKGGKQIVPQKQQLLDAVLKNYDKPKMVVVRI